MINIESLRQFGLEQLKTINPENRDYFEMRTFITNYQFNLKYQDERYVWLTCVLALNSVSSGNFGVGSVLVNGDGNIIVWGHNEVFCPQFHSDRHAEMVVMNKFEDDYEKYGSKRGYKLYTSLEPCPMCLARLITSGISTVLYAAIDKTGGMVKRMMKLPPTWIKLAKRNNYRQASCSRDLVEAALRIFLINANELNEKLGKP